MLTCQMQRGVCLPQAPLEELLLLGEGVGNSQDMLTLFSPHVHLNGSMPDTRFT